MGCGVGCPSLTTCCRILEVPFGRGRVVFSSIMKSTQFRPLCPIMRSSKVARKEVEEEADDEEEEEVVPDNPRGR